MEKLILDYEFTEKEIPYGGIVDNPAFKDLELSMRKLEEGIKNEIMKFTSSYNITPQISIDITELKTKCSADAVFRIPEVKVKVLI